MRSAARVTDDEPDQGDRRRGRPGRSVRCGRRLDALGTLCALTFPPAPTIRRTMNVVLIVILLAALRACCCSSSGSGVRTTLDLHFKGDVKRETRWLAQYGQSACTPVAVLLVWDLDPRGLQRRVAGRRRGRGDGVVVMVLKRLLGRVRPGRENAGQFLGPRSSTPTTARASRRATRPAPSRCRRCWRTLPAGGRRRSGRWRSCARRCATCSTPTGPATSSPACLVGYVIAHGTLVAFDVSGSRRPRLAAIMLPTTIGSAVDPGCR